MQFRFQNIIEVRKRFPIPLPLHVRAWIWSIYYLNVIALINRQNKVRNFWMGCCTSHHLLFLLFQRLKGCKNAVYTGVDTNWRNVAPLDNPIAINDKECSFSCPILLTIYAILPRYFPFWMEV
jgi:hypothetical protein